MDKTTVIAKINDKKFLIEGESEIDAVIERKSALIKPTNEFLIKNVSDMIKYVPQEDLDDFLIDLRKLITMAHIYNMEPEQFTWINNHKHDCQVNINVDCSGYDDKEIENFTEELSKIYNSLQ